MLTRARRSRLRPRVRERRPRPRRRHLRRARAAPISLPAVQLDADNWLTLARLAGRAGCAARRCRRGSAAARPPPHPSRATPRRSRTTTTFERLLRLVLGPSMTYSCAVWPTPRSRRSRTRRPPSTSSICRKLGLRPGMRLLDVGCGWGGMAVHAAAALRRAAPSASRCRAARPNTRSTRSRKPALDDHVEIRVPGLPRRRRRTVRRDQLDRHVRARRRGPSRRVLRRASTRSCARSGRVLNHGISRTPGRPQPRSRRQSFIDRYVFPDGELHEMGRVVSRMQRAGFEVRHVESLREHYAPHLARVGREPRSGRGTRPCDWPAPAGRAIWRLYMAASAVNFEDGPIQVHQIARGAEPIAA